MSITIEDAVKGGVHEIANLVATSVLNRKGEWRWQQST